MAKVSMPKVTLPTSISKKKSPKPAPTPSAAPAPAVVTKAPAERVPAKEEIHFDITQTIYTQMKGVWAWGKTVVVVET